MDLIKEYLDKRAHETDAIKKYQSKQKKIISWQKKMKLKKISFIHKLSTKRINKIRLKLSNPSLDKIDSLDTSLEETPKNVFSNIFSDAVLSYATKCDLEEGFKREHDAKNASPIEKFARFENKIRKSFRKSYQQNFPDSMDVLEDVLNLMFDKSDNSFKKTVKVNTKEIWVLPDVSAKHLNMKLSYSDQIQYLVQQDMDVCRKFNALPKTAFGKTFSNNFKMEAKENDFKTRWNNWHCLSHHKELETFAAVWKNITHLQTTRKFCMWLANNRNVIPPSFLEDEGLLRKNLSFDYSANSNSTYDEYVSPEDFIDRAFHPSRRLTFEDSSPNSSEIASTFGSVDISDINIIV